MPVDYAALAAQARQQPATVAPVDYAALAAKARSAKPATTTPQTPQPSRDWSAQLGLHEPTANPALGFMRGAGTAAADAAQGAVGGALSTLYQGGDLIRRGVGAEPVLNNPQLRDALQAPNSFAGQAGRMFEQGAEFAVPLTRVSKAVAGAGLAKRALAEGAASAGVAGVQSGGDPGAMVVAGVAGGVLPFAGAAARGTGRMVQRAAAGAEEGGLGGAIAGAVRSAAPQAPKKMVTQGLKPRSALTQWETSLDRALPEIKAAEAALGPIRGVDDLLAATKAAKKDIQAQLNQMRGTQRAIGAEVDLSPVADAAAKSIPRKLRLENPDAAKALQSAADVYRGPFQLDDAEQLLRETNAELDGLYALFPGKRHAVLTSNPQAASLDAKARALRDAIYQKLDDPGQGEAARELNRRYGALLDVEDAAYRRSLVAQRQQPESLSEQIGAVRAAADLARGAWRLAHLDPAGAMDIAAAHAGRSTAKAIKESQTADALVRHAFASYKGQRVPVAMPPPREIRGLLPPASRRTGPAPDPSFVRGVPAMPAQSERLALPAGRPPIAARAAETSGGGAVPARSIVQRDPRTGRMRRVYLSGTER